MNITGLNLGNVEAGSEGSFRSASIVEEIMESCDRERLMFLVNLSEDNRGETTVGLDLSLLFSLVIVDFAANSVSELGGADEGHDVRVVLENQYLLGGGLIIGSRSNFNNGALFEVGELNP